MASKPKKYAMSAQAAHSLAEVLTLLMSSIPIAIVVTGPTTSDHYALAGAALAALIAGLYALSRRRAFLNVALTVISSAGVGTMGPGIFLIIMQLISPSFVTYLYTALTWHAYAGGGFFFGLGGWALVHAIIERWEVHADNVAGKAFKFVDDEE